MDGPLKILRFGKKAIYLPRFTIALIRTPRLSPYHAKFEVPLNFSKFDLRDYLFHAYNVRALSVRSSIKQQPLRGVPEDPRRLFRPESKKYMTIEMDRPFVWPKEPEDFTPWGKKDREHDEKAMVETSVGREMAEQIKGMREHAKSMVMGEEVGLSAWEKQRSGKYIRAEEDSYKIKV